MGTDLRVLMILRISDLEVQLPHAPKVAYLSVLPLPAALGADSDHLSSELTEAVRLKTLSKDDCDEQKLVAINQTIQSHVFQQ